MWFLNFNYFFAYIFNRKQHFDYHVTVKTEFLRRNSLIFHINIYIYLFTHIKSFIICIDHSVKVEIIAKGELKASVVFFGQLSHLKCGCLFDDGSVWKHGKAAPVADGQEGNAIVRSNELDLIFQSSYTTNNQYSGKFFFKSKK